MYTTDYISLVGGSTGCPNWRKNLVGSWQSWKVEADFVESDGDPRTGF